MRLLIIPATFPNPTNPNPNIWILRQCQALVQRGHELRVAYAVPYALPLGRKWKAYRAIPSEYTYENIRVKIIRAFTPPKMLALEFVRLQVRKALRELVAEFRPDIVHVNCLIPPGFFATGLSRPVVLTAHGSDAYLYPRQRPDLRAAALASIKSAAQVVAVSAFIKREAEQLGAVNVRVVPNGADPKVFSPQDRLAARQAGSLPPARPLIVYAGTIERPKGLFDLLEAVRSLADLNPMFVMAGQGPDVAVVTKAFAAARIDTSYLGFLSQTKLAQLFAAADVVTLPSYGEGLPTVLCETMLAGRAIVASAVGGIPEIVRNNETGLVVPVGDQRALGSALRSVLTNPILRGRFEENAYEFAMRHLTWSANVQAYENIYAGVLHRRKEFK